ncbi:MAG: protein phosphatase 2C domain-containing protein [Prevotellaceae bacterium]|jgi:hypothetical protein|nr:protein phosphatase 2C domain-containing protein [Prevotellaceae bacterium]
MKRVFLIIVTALVGCNFMFGQYADTTEANNAGRYQTKELLQQKQKDYKNHKINSVDGNTIKIGGKNQEDTWYIKDVALSDYGTKVKEGFQEEKAAGFEYEKIKAKDGFEIEYTLYKEKTSEWNTQLGKGWKTAKADAGDDCVEIKVLKSDKSSGTLYGKLSEIAETKDLISQGYISKSEKENGTEYDKKEVDIAGLKVTLYMKKAVVKSSVNKDNSTQTIQNNGSQKSGQKEADKTPQKEASKNEQTNNQATIDSLKQIIESTKKQMNDITDTNSREYQELQNTLDDLNGRVSDLEGDSSTFRIVIIVLVLIIVCLLTGLVLKNRKKKNIVIMQPTQNQTPQQQPTQTETVMLVDTVSNPQQQQPTPQPEPQSVPVPPVTPLPPIPTKPIDAFAADKDEWIVVGASVIGNGHISQKLPCQDSHKYEYLGEGWGIAVTSDGAGSAQNSHIGSKIVAERALFHFKDLIIRRNWIKKSELPTEMEWSQICFATLKLVRNDMEMFAKQKNIELKSLYATVIVVIHTPDGILATHIGDGRAGYKNEKGEWKALITPHKGEEANQTIFVPSDFWDIPAYKMSGVLVPESIVVAEKPFAFTLMSDGCESTAWLYNQQDEKTGKFFDPNKPYPNFFNPLSETLQSFRNDKIDEKERAEKWGNFIESGNASFKKETDDKTMILGVVYM